MTKKMTIELPDGVALHYRTDNDEHYIFPNAAASIDVTTPEAADELKKRIDEAVAKAKRPAGMPEEGQEVFVLYANGVIGRCVWRDGNSDDQDLLERGAIFFTQEAAEKEDARRLALQRVKVWIAENTEPLQSHEMGLCITYNPDIQQFYSYQRDILNPVGLELPYLRSGDAGRLIESCEADLRTLAGTE